MNSFRVRRKTFNEFKSHETQPHLRDYIFPEFIQPLYPLTLSVYHSTIQFPCDMRQLVCLNASVKLPESREDFLFHLKQLMRTHTQYNHLASQLLHIIYDQKNISN